MPQNKSSSTTKFLRKTFEADNLGDDSEVSNQNDTMFESLTSPDNLHRIFIDNAELETQLDSGIDQSILNNTDIETDTPGGAEVPLSAQRVRSGPEEAACPPAVSTTIPSNLVPPSYNAQIVGRGDVPVRTRIYRAVRPRNHLDL